MKVLELKKLIDNLPDDAEILIDGTNLVDDAYYYYNGGRLKVQEIRKGERHILLLPDY